MDTFERQLGELGVQGQLLDSAMDGATSSMTPVDEVDDLIRSAVRATQVHMPIADIPGWCAIRCPQRAVFTGRQQRMSGRVNLTHNRHRCT